MSRSKDGKSAHIGRVRATDAKQVLDASGHIVAPGFVDLHTHYNNQFFYDPWCSLSGWHGVTSAVIGNCGFGFAPARPKDRDYLMRTLNRVEPLNPLLIYVMGLEGAKTRDATDAERDQMAALLREAMDAGACGWSAQRTKPGAGFDMQRDFDGTPFATDLMSDELALALGAVLADYEHAFLQTLVSSHDPDADLKHLEDLARACDSSIVYGPVGTDTRRPDLHKKMFAWTRQCQLDGLKMYAQAFTVGDFFVFSIADAFNMWDESPAWREATLGTVEEKLAKFKDPAMRKRLLEHPPSVFMIERNIILKTFTEKFMPAKGTLVPDGARLCGYDDAIEFFIDMVIEDELKTLIQIPALNDDTTMMRDLVVEPFALWGVSDGGAHQKFLTTGNATTKSIIDYVRDQELVTLEEGHWRMSTLPAHCGGFKKRGTLVEGNAADVIVYDYENLELLPSEVAFDLPAGDWRRIQKAKGYRYTIVNGTVTFEDGVCTGATPGKLLRHGG